MSKYFSGLNVEEMPVEFKKEVEEIDNIKNMEERHVKLVKLLTEYREDVGGYRKFDEKKYYRIIQRHGHISVNNPVVDFTTFFWMDLNFNTDVGGGYRKPHRWYV